MLHITIISVGRLKERFWTQSCDEYLKRLKPYADVRIVELADVDSQKAGGSAQAVKQESCSILQAIPERATVILLDIKGTLISSEGIAAAFHDFALEGQNDLCFIVGGSCGVDEKVRKRADKRWSFGAITLPHNLARVVLLEQIYRAFKINKGEPYHK